MVCVILSILCISLGLNTNSVKAEVTAPTLQVNAKAAILIDVETGQVLYAYNENELLHPASMVKMMTEYLVMEAIKSGTLSWDTQVVASEYAAAIEGSGGLIAAGHTYSIEDLFKQMSIYSSNDATVLLAETVAGGTEEDFVRMMNDKAREFGLDEGAHFTNATGLDKGFTPPEVTPNIPGETLFTAHDAAKIARRIILDHPEVLNFTKIPRTEAWAGGPMIDNWNWMLEGWKDYNNNFTPFAYEGLDGLKTGTTELAKYNFTGTAQRGNMRLVSVVMGADDKSARFAETQKLLDYGFNNFEKKTILMPKAKVDVLQQVDIPKGKEKQVDVVLKEGLEVFVLKGMTEEAFTVTAEPLDEEERTAPIEAGQTLGTVTITYNGADIGIAETTKIDLVAVDDVEKAGWFTLLLRAIGSFFSDLFTSIKNIF